MLDERKYSVHIAPAADEKMYAHICFLAQVSVTAARRLREKMSETIASLDYSPEGCTRYFTEKPTKTVLRYRLCTKRYRIVFDVIGDVVYIHDVQDCRQDTDKHLV